MQAVGRFLTSASLFFFILGPLMAYHPGKWSHTDHYLLQGGKNGPSELRVFDESGKLLQKALYIYRNDGKLLVEKYINGKGEYTGKTEYDYDSSGVLRRESLYDNQGKLLNRSSYDFRGGLLKSTGIYDGSGNLILTQNFEHSGGRITGGEEISGSQKDLYRFEYEGGRLIRVAVLGNQNEVLSKVDYAYTGEQLIERRREQGSSVSTCRYEYDAGGKLVSYTFYNLENGQWKFDKKLLLVY